MSRSLIALALALAACGRIGFDAPPDAPVAFAWRQRIDVLGSRLAANLTGFPLYVHVGAAGPDGVPTPNDLRFFADDGVTPLAFELEAPAHGGTLFDAWVRMPAIPAADISIYAYWGEPDAQPASDAHAVWAAPFAGVWHLADTVDSSANDLRGAFTGTQIVGGVTALGRDTNQHGYFEVEDAPALEQVGAGGAATWSAWVKLDAWPMLPGVGTAIGRQTGTSGQNDFRLGPSPGGGFSSEIAIDPGPTTIALDGGDVPLATWTQLALVLDHTEVRHYVNGERIVTMPVTGPLHRTAKRLLIGADCNGCEPFPPNDDFIDGTIDEVRVVDAALSEAWLRAEYLDLTGALTIVQDPEPL